MAGRLHGRRILVTGAASGMGRSIAEMFGAEGAALALLDLNDEGVRAVAVELGAVGFACDVSDRLAVQEVVAKAGGVMGGIDGIVNAAGILVIKPFGELEPESWDRMLAINLTGPFNIIYAALPMLRVAEKATIVNIASTSALMPMAGTTGYSASKAGLAMFTKCLASILAPIFAPIPSAMVSSKRR